MQKREGLTALEMRTVLTLLWGVCFVPSAAQYLNVREARIRYWVNEKQDRSPHASGAGVKRELLELLRRRAALDPELLNERLAEMQAITRWAEDVVWDASPQVRSTSA